MYFHYYDLFYHFFFSEACIYGCTQGNLLVHILKNEGPRSMYLGLAPALTRSVVYGGLRLGLYEPSKYVCEQVFGSTNIFVKIASGAFAGGFATALTNPVEVVKVMFPCQMNLNCFS